MSHFQHRDSIMEQQLDYQEIAMYFDRLVRRHDVRKTLSLARKMFAEYLNDDWKRDLKEKQERERQQEQGAGGSADSVVGRSAGTARPVDTE